jgi:two-component system, OmpR family, phosphate regulon response regulator PhoB
MGEGPRILVVADDLLHRTLLCGWLRAERYQVQTLRNGSDARSFLAERWADLLILDWDLPGLSGERLLAWLRGRFGAHPPMIFQMVDRSDADVVRILDTGADDFLVKPLDRRVLLARIRAAFRRLAGARTDSQRLLVGQYRLDRSQQTIAYGNRLHALGAKEFDLLWCLASRPGTLVQRQDLHSLVWGWDGGAQSRSVDMYISRLRARLREVDVPWTIQSVYGRGYRLNLVGCVDASVGWAAV